MSDKIDIEVRTGGFMWFSDAGCGNCVHEKVCGLWRDLGKIVDMCGTFRMQFDCNDYLKESPNA